MDGVACLGHVSLIGAGCGESYVEYDYLGDPAILVHSDNVTIRGFSIRGLQGGIMLSGAHYCNILDNCIYNSDHTGIYIEGADYTLIMNNIIFSNETGIYVGFSSFCEIYCNDIYENGPDNLTGIYLEYDSWNNIINFNNIYGNGWGVINDNPDGVDATNNWWGAPDGPSTPTNGGSGNGVSEHVSYDPWLTEECVDCPFDEEPTPSPSQPPVPGETVGGDVFPMNKAALLAPWIALAAAIIVGGIILRRRKVHS